MSKVVEVFSYIGLGIAGVLAIVLYTAMVKNK